MYTNNTTKQFYVKVLALAASTFLAGGTYARAQSLQDALRQTTISGTAGATDFSYANNGHTGNFANGFAVGGNVTVHTGALDGFSLGVAGFTGQSLGLYNNNPSHDDTELTGITHSLQSIREAYLQYENSWLEVRGGRQFINTPYANQDWYTFSPRSFMGFSGVINVIGSNGTSASSAPFSLSTSSAKLSVFAARIFGYNSRYSSTFTTGNRYISNSNGFIVGGVRYQNAFGGVKYGLQGWYYDFYGLAQLIYGQADFSTPISPDNTVFGAIQGMGEGNSGTRSSNFVGFSTTSNVNAHIYGAKLGMSFGDDNVALIADYSPISYSSFRHGGGIHPYNDNSGTTFTDTMQTGIMDFGPGYAVGVTGNIFLLHNKLEISPTYVEYNVDYGYGGNTFTYGGFYGFNSSLTPIHNEAIHVIDANFDYSLSNVLKGLSVDWDTDAAFAESGNLPGQHYNNPFFSSRAYLKYAF
ncbi:hypothetical protein [Acidiphilium sp.]|uniref:hypothetical protein n=1 Tax=Acidiphilium sp. TaxID=527 RepID=UPI003D06C631